MEAGKAAGGEGAGSWYVTREEAERGSPSRRDGVGAAKEAALRATYCSFIRDVGIRLQLPQTVATVCVFLASKIEDTPCSLQHVAIVAYETMYRKDSGAAHRINQKEVLEKQKDLILVGETLLLSTIRFDFNIQHPYEPLKIALNNLGITQKEVKQVVVNLINDALRTTLVVQFKPHYIAAGSLYLAAKFNNVRLPSEKGKVWWHEFDVAPKQLQAVIQQMTELFMRRNPCSIKPPPTPSPTERQQIISSSDSVLRHTHSSIRSLSNFDKGASRCMPVDCSANYMSTVCSARNEGNPSLRMHMDHSNFSGARLEKQSSLGDLNADHVYHVFSGAKDLRVTRIGDLIRHKRTIHEVGQHPAPNDKSDRGAWIRRQQRNVLVVEAKSSSWKKQKLWS